jgi:hypothetical protein
MEQACHRFELLAYIWVDGFCSYVFDEDDKPFLFDSLEEAVAELQDDFDIWAQQIGDGEREYGFDPEEFMIRCVTTDARCRLELSDGRLRLVSVESGEVIHGQEYGRVNRSGLF